MEFDVIVIGDYFIDLIFSGLAQPPEMGREVFSRDFAMVPGGPYNTAVTLHRLGVRTGWACNFGSDAFSRFVYQEAVKEGLDQALFAHHEQPMRRITVAASQAHERAFISYQDPEPSIPEAMHALGGVAGRVFFIPGLHYGQDFIEAARRLRSGGMKLFMDGNSSFETLENLPGLEQVITGMDVFSVNASEARRMTGEQDNLKAIQRLGALCSLVLVKDGANGAYGAMGGRVIHQPALPVTPVETTGAGDCFNAGFVKAWLDGKPFEMCLRWGVVTGGLSTLGMGASSQVVRAEDVEKYLSGAP